MRNQDERQEPTAAGAGGSSALRLRICADELINICSHGASEIERGGNDSDRGTNGEQRQRSDLCEDMGLMHSLWGL